MLIQHTTQYNTIKNKKNMSKVKLISKISINIVDDDFAKQKNGLLIKNRNIYYNEIAPNDMGLYVIYLEVKVGDIFMLVYRDKEYHMLPYHEDECYIAELSYNLYFNDTRGLEYICEKQRVDNKDKILQDQITQLKEQLIMKDGIIKMKDEMIKMKDEMIKMKDEMMKI